MFENGWICIVENYIYGVFVSFWIDFGKVFLVVVCIGEKIFFLEFGGESSGCWLFNRGGRSMNYCYRVNDWGGVRWFLFFNCFRDNEGGLS